ncbi:5071_t:CDS:2 [Racocetra persica]|uniref:5071_t:CDS:1 n=1 Tax=Racocetra persica TaxID=160502 RepID=A0ACA9KDV9_9GLOM|nr:5071_t:CDS:2 [Racocetra persica]
MTTNNGKGSERTSVQVALRIKPLINDDLNPLPRFQRQVITTNPAIPNSIVVQGEKKQVFSYDYVFGPESTQEEVYTNAIVKLVENFLDGYNVTILAYGQTSSGKTHTMGTADNSSISPDSKGIIPRAMETLFSSMNSLNCKNQKFSIKVSFIEIYNEDLIDLLGEGDMESRSQVTIREDSKGNILWNGLQEIKVNGVDDVMSHLARGSMNRQVGATEMNSQSSRSHAIFSVIMAQQKFVGSPMPAAPAPARPATPSRLDSSRIARSSSNLNLRMSRRFDEGDWVTVTSKFHFVDLAGSERLKRTSAVGERAKEGISINGGLLALGNVISALGDQNKAKHVTHVPYRDSKLTRLLQDSLGGNAKTLMIACVSSSESNLNETINTLKYANRARNIKNSISINQEESGWNDLEHLQSLVLKLRSEIKALKASNSNVSTNSTNSGRSSYSSGRIPVTVVTDTDGKSNTELEMLEEQLVLLQRSYSELSQKYAKTSAELAMHQDNSDENFDFNALKEKENSLIKRASDSFQEAVEPVIEEYEKLISSLESQLALTRAALSHTETMVQDQDNKLEHLEQINKQYKNLINDLRNNIAQLSEREATNEHYIKDLESKLETQVEEHNNDQILINELKSKISQLKTTSTNSEGYIHDLEARLEASEQQLIEINKTVERLENKLKDKEDAYSELKEKFDQAEVDQEKTLLLNELNDRDRRIALLEQKTDELSSELIKLGNSKSQESDQINHQGHQGIISGFSSASDEEKLLLSSIAPGTLSLKDEQDRIIIANLEAKISELQQIHEKTVIEFTQIKAKYEACLDEIQELQTQLSEARLIDAEMMDDFKSISSTPTTPMSPSSVMGLMESPVTVRQSLPPCMRFDELEKDRFYPISTSEKNIPRKPRSYSMGGHAPIRDTLNIGDPTQKSIEMLEEKLVALQELSSKSDNIPNLQSEQSLVVALRTQFETLKLDIKRKYELIEILKRDFIDKGILQQKLREKETEAVELKLQLSEVKSRQEETQNQMKNLQLQLKQAESIGADQSLLHSEIENVRKELQVVKENEASALEKIGILNDKETKLNEELRRLRNIEIAQRERINLLEGQLSSQNVFMDDDIIRLRNELVITKESEKSYKRTILDLESKLEKSEHEFSSLRAKIDILKSRTHGQKDQIQSHESQLSKMISSLGPNVDSQQINVLNKEIENLRSQDIIQRKKIDVLENRLKLIKQDSKTEDLKKEISELKDIESNLKNTIKELESKLEISEKECEDLRVLRNEIKFLKEFESEQKSTIEQLQSQLDDTIKSKNTLILEFESLKKEHDAKNERIICLESELKTIKEELLQTNDKNVAYSKEITELNNLLTDMLQKRDKEQKRIKELEVELQETKDSDTTGNNNVRSLKEELASAKIEMDVQNDLIADLKTKLLEAEKERDKHAAYVKEQTKIFETKEIEHKNEVSELQRSITNLQTELVEFKNSSQKDQKTIANLENELATVGSLLNEAKATEEDRAQIAVQLEIKLKQTDCDLKAKEQMLSIKDEHITQLELQIQNNKVDIETIESEVKKRIETTQASVIKELEVALKGKQDTLNKLQETIQEINYELEQVKGSDVQKQELISALESKLQTAESNHDAEISRLHEANKEIEILKEQCKLLQSAAEDAKMEIMHNAKNGIDSSTIENLTSQLQQAHSEIELYRNRVQELEKITQKLESDKQIQLTNNKNITQQIGNLQRDFDNLSAEYTKTVIELEKADMLTSEQKSHTIELERALEDVEKSIVETSTQKSPDNNSNTLESSLNLTIEKLMIENENLRIINDRLNSKVSTTEEEVNSLNESLKTVRNELEHLQSISNQISMESLEGKVAELEAEKESLEQANKVFFEERKKLDQRIDSLLKQLQTSDHGGNKAAAQLVELNTKLISLEKEHADLKQRTDYEALEMEKEIKMLLEINEKLEKEIAQKSSRNGAIFEIDLESESVLPQSHLSDLNLESSNKHQLRRQESTISKQNNLIKVFQEKVSELERRLQEETVCRRPSICVSEYENVDRFRLSACSTISEGSSPTDLTVEVQKLHKKVTKIEGENARHRQQVETLESALSEKDINLRVAKQQLQILQKEKSDLITQIKNLHSQLDETTVQFENTRTSVYQEKKVIEAVLEEERKAKEDAEKQRRLLESRMEELMSRKSKFMCF